MKSDPASQKDQKQVDENTSQKPSVNWNLYAFYFFAGTVILGILEMAYTFLTL